MKDTTNTRVVENIATPPSGVLWNRRFISLAAAIFLAFVNVAVFFQFYQYLSSLAIDPKWFGMIIGLFSAMSLILRPVISPLLHARNALRWILICNAGVMVCLAAYGQAGSLWSMFLVRALHGITHVGLATALMTVIISLIPLERSGQSFGLLSIVTLLPYAAIPPLLPVLTSWLGGYRNVLVFFAVVMILVFPLVLMGVPDQRQSADPAEMQRLSFREVLESLKDAKILVLFSVMLFFFSSYALVFYFLAEFGRTIQTAVAGLFFTLSSMSEIGVRLVAGSLFDKGDKIRLAVWSLIGIAVGYGLLGYVHGSLSLLALGVFLGLGWGVAMPILNALVFDISEPRLRTFNVNLGMQMYQGGFFLGPFVGGLIVLHWGFRALFSVCAGFTLISVVLLAYLKSCRENE
ncbi:MAG: MFS transporter [Deltaproteobacteria bacterium]|nr:MFS transporter [Deltaproteobacteria bacterium]